jgi:hypothetical protein
MNVRLTAIAAFALICASSVNAEAYTGFLDKFSADGPVWGFSTYKLKASYSGAFALVRRHSDGFATTIGFNSSNEADHSALSSFCSGTFCDVITLYDQVSGDNATCSNVRVFVAADGRVAVAPGPGGLCKAPYVAALASPKLEMFAVASPMLSDNRPTQPGIPKVVTTGTVTKGNNTVSNIASLAGIAAGGQYGLL